MRVAFLIAWRYLKARKKAQFVNLITGFSFVGVIIGTAAIIIVLSVYNGLESLAATMFSRFDPELRIEPIIGKTIDLQNKNLKSISQWPEVRLFDPIIEENALIRYGDAEYIVRLKGISKQALLEAKLNDAMYAGLPSLYTQDGYDGVLTGVGVAASLGIDIKDGFNLLSIYLPKRTENNSLSPENAFNKIFLPPVGVFDIKSDANNQLAFIPIEQMAKLMEYDSLATSIGVYSAKKIRLKSLQKKIQKTLGQEFLVLDRFEQHADVFRIFQSEKWWTFLLLSLIVLVAALNLIGSLTMMVVEKQPENLLLQSMGMAKKDIGLIYQITGLMVTSVGLCIGCIFGVLLVFLQQKFGIITFQGVGDFAVEAYPVVLQFSDILITIPIVFLIGAVCSYLPSKIAERNLDIQLLRRIF